MKKNKILIFCLLICFIFSGCIEKRTELKDLSVIQGLGIDKSENDFNISIQIFNPARVSGSPNELCGNITKILCSKGKSIYEAIYKASGKMGGEPFISQNYIIVLGNSFHTENIENLLNYFHSNYETRMNIIVAISKCDAKDILEVDPGDALIPAKNIVDIIQMSEKNLMVYKTDLFSILKSMKENDGEYCITALNMTKETNKLDLENKISKNIITDGIGIFKKNKLVGYLEEDECEGLLWITKNIHDGVLVTETEKYGRVSTKILKTIPKIKVSYQQNVPICNIDIKCFLNINDNQIEDFNLDSLSLISDQISNQIKIKIEKAIKKCVIDYNVDIFRLKDYFKNYDPKRYKLVKDDWHNYIKTIQFKTNVEVEIIRAGEKYIKKD